MTEPATLVDTDPLELFLDAIFKVIISDEPIESDSKQHERIEVMTSK